MNYDTFDRKYREFIASLPGSVNLPQGYMQNARMWDYWLIFERVTFDRGIEVLDTGSLHTFFGLYVSRYAYTVVSDNFAWAERDYASGLMTPWEWRCVVEALGEGSIAAEDNDIRHLDWPDEQFDYVLCISTIEHVIEDRKAILEMVRVLKPGGKLLLTTEYAPTSKPYSEEDGSYYRIYNQAGIEALTEGLNVTFQTVNPDNYGHSYHTLFLEITK